MLAQRGGERVRAAAGREHHDDREHEEQAPLAAPVRRSGRGAGLEGAAGGPGGNGGAGGLTGLAPLNGLAALNADAGYLGSWYPAA